MQGVALGTTTAAQWKQMGAAIVAGVEAGWVNPVINKVREREKERPSPGYNVYSDTTFFSFPKIPCS